jgi:bifunctional UDP-N-acetylglucosamine pyrophosphorylase/glucosamine-1-phosphate N-acetyltransferase
MKTMPKTYGLVLAAGKGTRMKTEMPKCAYPILKKPMIEYIVEKLEKTKIEETVVVVGHQKEVLMDILKDRVHYAEQTEQLGTGHAALSAAPILEDKEGVTFILPGDMPLMEIKLTDKILKAHEEMGNDLTVVSMVFDNPKSYGRIVRDQYGAIAAIVEDKDCTGEQKKIQEVNSGVYVVNNKALFKVLRTIKKNERKGEYYLTDIVALMRHDYKIGSFVVRDAYQMMGVNDLYSVSIAERYLRDEINRNHMLNGVEMVSPNTITIGHNVIIEPGVTIYPNTTITGDSVIRERAVIGPNTEIHNGRIDEHAEIKHSLVYDSIVGAYTTVGPFAHLRNHAEIGTHNRIGNFVEVKKSSTGTNTKAAHLSYIGDAEVGSNVNFGCGSITVNYDGVNKHKTKIGDDVFIGCNVNMVAPLTIEDEVFIAAGSTVTTDVPKGSLSIARNQQINKADYYHNLIKPKPKADK